MAKRASPSELFKPRKYARNDNANSVPLLPQPSTITDAARSDKLASPPATERSPRTPQRPQQWIKPREQAEPVVVVVVDQPPPKPELSPREELELKYHKQLLAFAELQQQALLAEIKEIAIDRELSRIRNKTLLLSQSL